MTHSLRQTHMLCLPTFCRDADGFPTELPTVVLSPEEMTADYGLGNGALPQQLGTQLDAFCHWSQSPVQLDRGPRYAIPVQSSTIRVHRNYIVSYMGYLCNIEGSTEWEDLSIKLYTDPGLFAGFISYLIARQAQQGHIMKHISLAHKVNDFLHNKAGSCHGWIDYRPSCPKLCRNQSRGMHRCGLRRVRGWTTWPRKHGSRCAGTEGLSKGTSAATLPSACNMRLSPPLPPVTQCRPSGSASFGPWFIQGTAANVAATRTAG
jgi:hypothetical protein